MATIINGDGIVTAEGTSTSQGQVRLGEDTDNGTNYVQIQAPASLAANRTVTLPDSDINFSTGLGVAQGGTGATTLTSNNVILGNGTSAVQFVAPGTNGNVLTSNGTTWTSAAASTGAVVFLQALTASNSATLDFETTIDSTYDTYMFVVSGIRPANDGTTLRARFKISGTYSESGYLSYVQYATSGGWGASSGTAALELLTPIGNASDRSCSCVAYLATPASTSLRKVWYGTGTQITNGSGDTQVNLFAGSNSSTTAVTGVRFYMSSGNITSGSVRMYGIKNS